jgi:formate-dependent nitrite reductase cytochrome c552 subunit
MPHIRRCAVWYVLNAMLNTTLRAMVNISYSPGTNEAGPDAHSSCAMRWDFATASHGASFHAPIEVASILGSGIEIVQEARIDLAKILSGLGVEQVIIPDISTKEKAQQAIGLDMNMIKNEKQEFKRTIIPAWKMKK